MNAKNLDLADELAPFRDRFVIEDPNLIYLDGNSLGRMPKSAAELIQGVAEKGWGEQLVRGWEDWFNLPERLGAKIARIIGAREDEVIVSDSTTVNLYKLLAAGLKHNPDRFVVVTDDLNFPSDLYAIRSALGDHELCVIKSPDGITLPIEELRKVLDQRVALLTLSHASFKSAFVHDMAAVTALAHSKGALVLWDLSHSAGAVSVNLADCGADLAIGCTYKYLNGGPGSPAFLYIRRDLQDELSSPIWGWFGHRNPFAFELEYEPVSGLRRFLVGTPPILSMIGIEPGLDLLLEAGLERIRAKSIRQTEFLADLWRERLEPLGFAFKSPTDPNCRGAHVSLGHPEALRIDKALIEEMRVVPDFRAPDNLRFGLSPLYTSFAEIEEGVRRLEEVVDHRLYEKFDSTPPKVT